MDDLPDEVLALLFAPLSCIERLRWVVPVCKRWRAVASDRGATGRSSCVETHSPTMTAAGWFDRQRKRKRACERALALGHVDCLLSTRPPSGELDAHLWRFAAQFPVDAAALDALNRVSKGAPCKDNVLRIALAHGQLRCVSLLLKAGAQFKSVDKVECACRYSHLWARWLCNDAPDEKTHAACLRLLLDDAQRVNDDTCYEAAAEGHVECLRVLLKHGYSCGEGAAAHAARTGRLDMLRLMHEYNHTWHWTATEGAAEAGQIDCLRYLHKIGCPWDESTTRYAASRGDLASLAYAHENGCPWSDQVCAVAAKYGYLDCLRYARENGCPWDRESVIAAATPVGHDRRCCCCQCCGINEDDRAACLAYALAQQDDTNGVA
ncbi:Ankyrin repeat domain containing protein [Pandoravirus salinus]|uniref:Ankyrin repeat domain containing protein n=1 Tax=Pandoravirus salinus TaxID=1349410 RepID=S4VY93_9VIRU|nr:ankyrin repeat domain [Pandoravirus salinus]AGO84426.1 Ankyrin repeat domain containing protein [Pandoravirus salinus]